MKRLLLLFMLTLVIVPTVILSFLAARTLKHDEIVAWELLKKNAVAGLEAAITQVDEQLDEVLRDIQIQVDDIIESGPSDVLMLEMDTEFETISPLVDGIYPYQDGWWVFTWPATSGIDARERIHDRRLLDAFRGRLSSGGARGTQAAVTSDSEGVLESRIPLRVDNRYYRFLISGKEQGYYTGFRFDMDGFKSLLQDRIEEAADSGIIISVEGPNFRFSTSAPRYPVVVSDSFGERSEMGATVVEENLLVKEVLSAPFDDTVIRAFSDDPDRLRQLATQHGRLLTWSIILLAAGIIGGVWIMIAMAHAEIQRSRSGTEFAIGISHDVRTPLAAMKMLAESIYLDHVKDVHKQKAFLSTIVSECDRLGHLIERVLYFVRFGQGALRYSLRAADVGLAVQESVDVFLALFPDGTAPNGDKRPIVELNVDDSLPRVMLDDGAFAQIILNLLDNAATYGKKRMNRGHAPPVWIGVSVARCMRCRKPWTLRHEWVRITVRDKGEGIRPSDRKRIFRKFYRARDASTEYLSGVGLGLAVCCAAAEGHAGWIDVDSEPGEGSAFHVFLPVVSGESES